MAGNLQLIVFTDENHKASAVSRVTLGVDPQKHEIQVCNSGHSNREKSVAEKSDSNREKHLREKQVFIVALEENLQLVDFSICMLLIIHCK